MFFYWWTAVGLFTLPATSSKTIQCLKWCAHGLWGSQRFVHCFLFYSKFSCYIVPQNSMKCRSSKGYQQGTDTRRNYNSPDVNKKKHFINSTDLTLHATKNYFTRNVQKCPMSRNSNSPRTSFKFIFCRIWNEKRWHASRIRDGYLYPNCGAIIASGSLSSPK